MDLTPPEVAGLLLLRDEVGALDPGDLDLIRKWLAPQPYPIDPATRAAFERLMETP